MGKRRQREVAPVLKRMTTSSGVKLVDPLPKTNPLFWEASGGSSSKEGERRDSSAVWPTETCIFMSTGAGSNSL